MILDQLRDLARAHGVKLLVTVPKKEPDWQVPWAIWWRDGDDSDIVGAGETWGECCEVALQELESWPIRLVPKAKVWPK